jgi:hypothetical protein
VEQNKGQRGEERRREKARRDSPAGADLLKQTIALSPRILTEGKLPMLILIDPSHPFCLFQRNFFPF